MASKAGLRKVTKTVRGKKGVVKRSYWVRAKEGVKGFVKRHPTAVKVGLGAAGALAAGLAIHKGLKLDRRVRAAKQQTYNEVLKTKEAIGGAGRASSATHSAVNQAKSARSRTSNAISEMHEKLRSMRNRSRDQGKPN